jgi:hypothetical protein
LPRGGRPLSWLGALEMDTRSRPGGSEIPASEPENLLGIARTSSRGEASVRVQDDGPSREAGPELSRPESPLAPRSFTFAGSPRHILGCKEAKRFADPSASPLSLDPLRT